MMEETNQMSVFDIFASSQETFEEARKKSNEESGQSTKYLRFNKDGNFLVRVLPLAPELDADGKLIPGARKGYEYPLRSLMLQIQSESANSDKPKLTYVNVCNIKQAFPQVQNDLIDLYVKTACEMYAKDEALCKQLKGTSFNGGLKWDSRRCMYVVDEENPKEGIQVLQLSYSQYKDVEERKLNTWNKLLKNNPKHPCPLSSPTNGYNLEVVRKTENKKVSYTFGLDVLGGESPLDEDTLTRLLDMPRLPEVLYRYSRFHLEATVVYLKQMDERYNIDVMSQEVIKDCIEKIGLILPAEDTSHFTLSGTGVDVEDSSADDIDSLWKRLDELDDEGLDDKSAEGQELRTQIKEFVEDQDLNIKIVRKKTNADLLDEIESLLANGEEEEEEEEPATPTKKRSRKATPVVEEDEAEEEEDEPEMVEEEPEEIEEDEAEEEEDEEPEEPARPTPRRSRGRNDDTNEPAARPERRKGRPARRR